MGDPRLWLLGLSIVLCTVLLAALGVLLTLELWGGLRFGPGWAME